MNARAPHRSRKGRCLIEGTMALRDENLTRCGFPYFPVLAPADGGEHRIHCLVP